MAVNLLIKWIDDAGSQKDKEFNQDVVEIGRDPEAHLCLHDENNRVGRRHARIIREGNTFKLEDLRSRNHTYLNGERLKAGQRYEIRSGDTIRICDYEVQIEVFTPELEVSTPDTAPPETEYITNPFKEHVLRLSAVLQGMKKVYEEEEEYLRDDMLYVELRRGLKDDGAREMVFLMAKALGGQPIHRTGADSEKAPDPDRLHRMLDAFIRFAFKLIQTPDIFQESFMKTTPSDLLNASDPEAVESQLLDAGLAEADFEHHLDRVAAGADRVLLHQMALLDGYKASAQNGAEALLSMVDAEILERELQQGNPLFRWIPILCRLEVLKQLKLKQQELKEDNWEAAERRVFWPKFIAAYLKRMASLR